MAGDGNDGSVLQEGDGRGNPPNLRVSVAETIGASTRFGAVQFNAIGFLVVKDGKVNVVQYSLVAGGKMVEARPGTKYTIGVR
jgi:hypothetical protein